MKEASALILVIVALAVGEALDAGLRVTFGVGPNPEAGTDYFHPMPVTITEATGEGWRQTSRPPGSLLQLRMYCMPSHEFCGLFDDNGHIAGVQVALSKNNFTYNVFDWKKRGFKLWKTTVRGRSMEMLALENLFVSAGSLKRSKKARLAARDPSRVLQENALWVTGTNGDLLRIPTNESELAKPGPHSAYTNQACFPGMGQHYFYNFSSTTPYNAENAYPWFPLYTNGELIGVGFATFGIYTPGTPNLFEIPSPNIIKLIAPRAPQWVYDLTADPGAVTMHIYFIEEPWLIKC